MFGDENASFVDIQFKAMAWWSAQINTFVGTIALVMHLLLMCIILSYDLYSHTEASQWRIEERDRIWCSWRKVVWIQRYKVPMEQRTLDIYWGGIMEIWPRIRGLMVQADKFEDSMETVYATYFLVDRAVDFIDEQKEASSSQPFVLFLSSGSSSWVIYNALWLTPPLARLNFMADLTSYDTMFDNLTFQVPQSAVAAYHTHPRIATMGFRDATAS